MSTITLPNIRVSSDLTVKLKLKDGGVALDWSTLQNIKVSIYSDAQRALAGRCSVAIDAEDSTLLVCTYAANKPQYVGVNRVVVSAKYMNETKTYDKPAFNFVRWTDDQEGQTITIDDPDIDVEISVEDVSSSILQEAVDAANTAAERANEAAEAAEHMVDIHTGPAGKSAYEVAVEEGYTGTEEEWLASLVGPQGPQGIQGETGEAAGFGTVSATLTEDGGNPGVTVAASGSDTAKQFAFTFKNLKGEKGDKGDQGNSGYTRAAGELEVVNNLTDGGAAKALSAEMGKTLEGEVSQLEHYPIDLTLAWKQGSLDSSHRYTNGMNTRIIGATLADRTISFKVASGYYALVTWWSEEYADPAMNSRGLGFLADNGAWLEGVQTIEPRIGCKSITITIKKGSAGTTVFGPEEGTTAITELVQYFPIHQVINEQGEDIEKVKEDEIVQTRPGMPDLEIGDNDGNALVWFYDGHIRTKNFDSKKIQTDAGIPAGKKIVFLGDSITAGVGNVPKTYVGFIADNTGWNCVNKGVGGTGYARYITGGQSFLQRYQSAIAGDEDLIVVWGGTNDYGSDIASNVDAPRFGDPDNPTDTTTFCGAVYALFKGLYENYALIPKLVITPLRRNVNHGGSTAQVQGSGDNENQDGKTLGDYCDIIKRYAAKFMIPVLDLYTEGEMPIDADDSLVSVFTRQIGGYNGDGLHPNSYSHEHIITPKIEQKILRIFNAI